MFPDLGREYLQQRAEGTLKPEALHAPELAGKSKVGAAQATEVVIDVHGETYEMAVTGVGGMDGGRRKIYLSLKRCLKRLCLSL